MARRFETLESRQLLSLAGVLDPSFGQGSGVVNIPFLYGATASAVAVQSNGQIVVAGGTSANNGAVGSELAVTRLNLDGSIDSTFGHQGQVIVADTQGASAIAIEPDGAIVLAGESYDTTTETQGAAVTVLNPDGSLDTSFGNGGTFTFQFQAGAGVLETVGGVAVEPDGSILVAGMNFGTLPTAPYSLAQVSLAKITPTGAFDTAFGNQGVALVNSPSSDEFISLSGIAVQSDGKIAVAADIGYDETEAAVIRFDANGQPDTGFGNGGTAIVSDVVASYAPNYDVFGIVAESNGDLVIGGTSNGYLASTRLLPTGALDTTYGNGGTGLLMGIQSAAADGSTGGMLVEPDGDVVVSITLDVPNTDPTTGLQFGEALPAVGRFTPTGSPDSTFGSPATPGIATVPNLTAPQNINGVALQADGNLVLVGGSGTANPTGLNASFEVLRVTGAVTPSTEQAPGDFEGTGVTPLSVYLADTGSFVFRPLSGPDVTVPFGYAGAGASIPAVGDYDGVGHAELGVYLSAYGVYAYRPASGGPDVTLPFGLPGVGQSIPTPADFSGNGVDDIAVYMPSLAAYGIRPSNGGPDEIVPIGVAGPGQSLPCPADYFGTGQADVAVYVASLGAFAIRPPGGGPDVIVPFGVPGVGNTIPVPGDYDGSGHVELAVYLPKTGQFIYRPYDGGPDVTIQAAKPGQPVIPDPGDYQGVGHLQFAYDDPTTANLTFFPEPTAPAVTVPFGAPGFGASLPSTTPPGAIPAELAPLTTPPLPIKTGTLTSQPIPGSTTTKVVTTTTTGATHPKKPTTAVKSIVQKTALAPVAQDAPDSSAKKS